MVLAIILGALVGVLGFLPLVGGLRMTRIVNAGSNAVSMSMLFLGIMVSMIVLALPLIIVGLNFRDLVFPFVLAEAIALVITAIVYGVIKLVRK